MNSKRERERENRKPHTHHPREIGLVCVCVAYKNSAANSLFVVNQLFVELSLFKTSIGKCHKQNYNGIIIGVRKKLS